MKTKSSLHRLHYLDWVRGLGALIMLQGHVFDSYLKPELRFGGAFTFSQFVGGMPPAMFLFLTGITLAFLMDSCERKGMTPRGHRPRPPFLRLFPVGRVSGFRRRRGQRDPPHPRRRHGPRDAMDGTR